ncbi:MAG TPA: fibrinogen-like YCDxxxxGGGW domain-containing protein, partial [Nannocystis sp.]
GEPETSGTTHVPACGDGTVDPGEACDDGNQADDDACLGNCVAARCGDGVVESGVEACDDGNEDDSDACLPTCEAASCGDGVVQAGVEECDDANKLETDECRSTCKHAKCGDGVVQAGVEACDDGNADDLDTCSTACEEQVPAASCKQILALAPAATSKVYLIDPDGDGVQDPFKTFCDMETDGGGWTLILNRNVNSDNTGQPDINTTNGAFDNTRASNWNFDIDRFWTGATQVVFADRQNDDCSNCKITDYHSAIRVEKPAGQVYKTDCLGASQMVSAHKLVGPNAGTSGTAYQCGTSLGWGSCGGKVCHLGTHHKDTALDADWGQNLWQEMHFPTTYSAAKSAGDFMVEPSAYCRSCGGGLPANFNESSTCCLSKQKNAKGRWTLWVR